MRFPSIDILARSSLRAAERFPLVLLSAAVSAFAASCLVEDVGEIQFFQRLIFAATLGLPLFVALEVFAERHAIVGWRRIGVWVVGAAALAAFLVASAGWSQEILGRRYAQLSVAFHLTVAFLPFVGRPGRRAFWQYNRALFERALLAALYTLILYAALAVAVGALDRLFGVPIPDEMYAHVWFGTAFLFSAWVFVAGVPQDLNALEVETEYPRSLKTFVQYLLIPIVSAYLAILTVYLAKVIITTTWPSGWIVYMVSSVAVVGILSVLLIHPIAEREENRWVATYVRGFYLGIVPSAVMLLLAIWKRIDQYGVTENRYFIVVLAVWLATIAVYYGITRSRNIRLIPTSLCALALVTLAGPWSAYAVSKHSQTSRLRHLFEANGMWVDGRVHSAPDNVSPEDAREMSAGLRYLTQTHGNEAVTAWLDEETAAQLANASGSPDAGARVLAERLGFAYVDRWQSNPGRRHVSYGRSIRPFSYPLAGYSHAVLLGGTMPDTVTSGPFTVVRDSTARTLRVLHAEAPDLVLPLDSVTAKGVAGVRDSLQAPIVFTAENDRIRAALIVQYFEGWQESGTFTPSMVRGEVLLGER